MQRATQIVATVGPASTEPDVLAKLINAGVDVVRLNFSHGVANDRMQRARDLPSTTFAARRSSR